MALSMFLAGTFLAGMFGSKGNIQTIMQDAAQDPNRVLSELSLGLGRHSEGGSSSSKQASFARAKSKSPFELEFDKAVQPEEHLKEKKPAKSSTAGRPSIHGDTSQLAAGDLEEGQKKSYTPPSFFESLENKSGSHNSYNKHKASAGLASLEADHLESHASLGLLQLKDRQLLRRSVVTDTANPENMDALINELQKNSKYREKQHEAEQYITKSVSQDTLGSESASLEESFVFGGKKEEVSEPFPLQLKSEAEVMPPEILGKPERRVSQFGQLPESVAENGDDIPPPPAAPEFESVKTKKEAPIAKGQIEKLSAALERKGVAISKKSKALQALNTVLSQVKSPKGKDELLEKVSSEVQHIASSLYGSEEGMIDELSRAFFPESNSKNLLPEQVEAINTAHTSLNGKILTSLLEEKPVDKDTLITSLVDETIKSGITETVKANALPDSAVMGLTLLITKQIKESPYLDAFKDENRERLLKAIPITVSTFQPKLPVTTNSKGETVIDTEVFLGETIIPIINSAQQLALDPAERIEVKATISAQSKEIDEVKFGEFVRAGLGKKADPIAAENYNKIMTEFYDEFLKELLGIPERVAVKDFMTSEDFKGKLETLSKLGAAELQKKIDESIKTASQNLTFEGENVTANKIISDLFKSEIHPETGLVRRTNSTDRAQILKDDFSLDNYFSKLGTGQSDQVQYLDPDDAGRKVNQKAVMTAAHKVVTTLHALVNVRPKLLVEAQKAKIKEEGNRKKKEELSLNLKKSFPTLLNDPAGVDLGKSQNTKSLETQLEAQGIKVTSEVLSVLTALKKPGLVSKFAKNIAEEVDRQLALPSDEELGKNLIKWMSLKPEVKSSKEIGKFISSSLRSQAFNQIAKGGTVNVTLPAPSEVLLNALKATGNIPDDLERILKKPLSAEGFVFSEEDKQKINAQVIFGLISRAKSKSIPMTESEKTDVAKFNLIFTDLANKAYQSLHPTAEELPFKDEVEEKEVNYDITKRIPDFLTGIYTALEEFMQGDLTKIVGFKSSDLLNLGMEHLKSKKLLEPSLENHTRQYFQSVISALEAKFLSELRVGKRLDRFESLEELVDTIMPAKSKDLPSTDEESDLPPPPPPGLIGDIADNSAPPPPPQVKAPGLDSKYKLLNTKHSVTVMDPSGVKKEEIQSIQVEPVHILLTLSSLWSESQKRKELAKKEHERERENAAMIDKIVQNLGALLEGKLELKQPVVVTSKVDDVFSSPALRKRFTYADLKKSEKEKTEKAEESGLSGAVLADTAGNASNTRLVGVSSSDVNRALENARNAKPTLKSLSAKSEIDEKIKLNSGSAPSKGEKARFIIKRGLGKANSTDPTEAK